MELEVDQWHGWYIFILGIQLTPQSIKIYIWETKGLPFVLYFDWDFAYIHTDYLLTEQNQCQKHW